MSTVVIPGWKTVIRDKTRQWEFEILCQYIDNPDIQMRLIDSWDLIEFDSCESHLIYSFKSSDPELIKLLTDDSTWKFGISGYDDAPEQDGWIEVFPHSVCAETRAWIREKYGDTSDGPAQYI
jgi:hypothetical protein